MGEDCGTRGIHFRVVGAAWVADTTYIILRPSSAVMKSVSCAQNTSYICAYLYSSTPIVFHHTCFHTVFPLLDAFHNRIDFDCGTAKGSGDKGNNP
jgi:hypothetical protein